ncbi:MAG: hypothetical protein ACYSWQ_27145 [Planctomycetota bacterium]|jgi:hypothetical protein
MKRLFVSSLLVSLLFAWTCAADSQINTHTTYDQKDADMAMDSAGRCLAVWTSYLQDGSSNGIFGRYLDLNGSPIGEEFQINGTSSGNQTEPAVAFTAAGFVAVWHGPGGIEQDGEGIFARRFDPNGLPATEAFQLNTVAFRSVTRPSIAMDSTGYFAAAWDGDPNLAALDDAHSRVFEPNGAPLGEQLLVNTTIEGPQRYPKLALNEIAEFVIVWESVPDPNVNEGDIFAQRFSNFGDPLGSEFQVNTYAEGDQRYSVARLGGDGQYVTAWQSYARMARVTAFSPPTDAWSARRISIMTPSLTCTTTGSWPISGSRKGPPCWRI